MGWSCSPEGLHLQEIQRWHKAFLATSALVSAEAEQRPPTQAVLNTSFLPSVLMWQCAQPWSAQGITLWANRDAVCQVFPSHRAPSDVIWLPRGTWLRWGADGVKCRARAVAQEEGEQLGCFAWSYRQQISRLGKACKNRSGKSK